jgi:hypothetical protein
MILGVSHALILKSNHDLGVRQQAIQTLSEADLRGLAFIWRAV